MKSILCLLFSFVLLAANAQTSQKKFAFTIEGKLTNFKKKKAVVHVAWEEPWKNGEFLEADVVDGKFVVKGTMSQPSVGYIRIVTYNDSLKPEQQFPWDCDLRSFFICSGKTTITGTDSLLTAKILSGCRENALLQSLDSSTAALDAEQATINTALQKAYASKDTCSIKTLEKSLTISNYKEWQVHEAFILRNPSSYMSLNLLNAYVYQYSDKFRLNVALGLIGRLSQQLQTSQLAIAIKERIDQRLYPVVNVPMPALTLKDMEGKDIDLAKFKGKVILIDFWASWCAPCRKEFPGLLAIYDKYKDQGFEIVGISIDINKSNWLQAIKKDKLTWPQLIDEQNATFDGKAGRLYRITAIPANFLVNRDGIVVADRVAVEQLEARLKKLLPATQ